MIYTSKRKALSLLPASLLGKGNMGVNTNKLFLLSSSGAKCLSRICFSMYYVEQVNFLVWWCLYIILAALHMFSIFFREGLGLDSLSTFSAPLFGCTFFNELGVHFTKLARQFHGGPICQKTSKLSTKSLLPFLLFLTIFIIIHHGKKSREEKKPMPTK